MRKGTVKALVSSVGGWVIVTGARMLDIEASCEVDHSLGYKLCPVITDELCRYPMLVDYLPQEELDYVGGIDFLLSRGVSVAR